MKRATLAGLGLLAVLLLFLAGTKFFPKPSAISPPAMEASQIERRKTTQPDPAKEKETRDAASRARISGDWRELMAWVASKPPPSEKEIQARLVETRTSWVAMDPQVMARTIGELLATGEDQPTGLPFKVGPHGMLRGCPTMRVFLLDALALSDPEMAMEIARGVLDSTTSGDEYAVALRSLTRTDIARADDAELLSRFSKMLGRDEWKTSAGFAEAFDLARFVGTEAAARQLVEWNGNPELRSMALHEFAAEHPLEAMNVVKDQPDTRAVLMARADPADPEQSAAIDNYFRKPALPDAEAIKFLKAFPLRSTTTGFRLYGKLPAPFTRERIAEGDRAALTIANGWIEDPALERLRPEIVTLQQRLLTWTQEAK